MTTVSFSDVLAAARIKILSLQSTWEKIDAAPLWKHAFYNIIGESKWESKFKIDRLLFSTLKYIEGQPHGFKELLQTLPNLLTETGLSSEQREQIVEGLDAKNIVDGLYMPTIVIALMNYFGINEKLKKAIFFDELKVKPDDIALVSIANPELYEGIKGMEKSADKKTLADADRIIKAILEPGYSE
jgi:hypothetical protein